MTTITFRAERPLGGNKFRQWKVDQFNLADFLIRFDEFVNSIDEEERKDLEFGPIITMDVYLFEKLDSNVLNKRPDEIFYINDVNGMIHLHIQKVFSRSNLYP